MLVKDAMSDKLVYCLPGHNLQEAAYKMLIADCGLVPVVNDMIERRLLGVLTDRDIVCRAIVHGHNPLRARVDDCMSHEAITVCGDLPLDVCCYKMAQFQVRRIVVVDEADRCCGVVSQSDIARVAPREIAAIMGALSTPRTALARGWISGG